MRRDQPKNKDFIIAFGITFILFTFTLFLFLFLCSLYFIKVNVNSKENKEFQR